MRTAFALLMLPLVPYDLPYDLPFYNYEFLSEQPMYITSMMFQAKPQYLKEVRKPRSSLYLATTFVVYKLTN